MPRVSSHARRDRLLGFTQPKPHDHDRAIRFSDRKPHGQWRLEPDAKLAVPRLAKRQGSRTENLVNRPGCCGDSPSITAGQKSRRELLLGSGATEHRVVHGRRSRSAITSASGRPVRSLPWRINSSGGPSSESRRSRGTRRGRNVPITFPSASQISVIEPICPSRWLVASSTITRCIGFLLRYTLLDTSLPCTFRIIKRLVQACRILGHVAPQTNDRHPHRRR